MSTKPIVYTPPPVESKTDPELAQKLNDMHQLIFDRFQNHFQAIGNLTSQISALQAQVKKLQGGK